MMKRKGIYFHKNTLLKWHIAAVMLFALMVAYKTIAEITYPGNASVPFEVFRPSIIEHLSYVLFLGATLAGHLVIRQSQRYVLEREYRKHLDSIDLSAYRASESRLEAFDDADEWIDENQRDSKEWNQR